MTYDAESTDEIISIYDKFADNFEEGNLMFSSPFVDDALQKAMRIFNLPISEIEVTVLGSATGREMEYLLNKGVKNCIGIDISPKMHMAAERRLQNDMDRARVIEGDFRSNMFHDIRKAHVVLCVAASDFQQDYFSHTYDIVRYAQDKAVVFTLEYPLGNLGDGINEIEYSTFSRTIADHTVSLFATLRMAGRGAKVFHNLFSNITSDGYRKFFELAKDRKFLEYTKKANSIPIDTIKRFAHQFPSTEHYYLKTPSFSPCFITFEVSTELRDVLQQRVIPSDF